jgi:hypothetical protein
MHPYKQIGNYDSYSQYNEGWQDAVSYIEAALPVPEKGTENHSTLPCGIEDEGDCADCGYACKQNAAPEKGV